jgi:2-oxoglutarate dehydrogenase complex dehydrogenase (E1) component-like enzyme
VQNDNMELLWGSSHIFGGNAAYVEALYEDYLRDPNAIDGEWRDYFDKLPRVNGYSARDIPHSQVVEQFAQLGRRRLSGAQAEESLSTSYERKQVHVVELIDAYRQRGIGKKILDHLGLPSESPQRTPARALFVGRVLGNDRDQNIALSDVTLDYDFFQWNDCGPNATPAEALGVTPCSVQVR